MADGNFGGNGSVQWQVNHSTALGTSVAKPTGGEGRDDVLYAHMRKNPATNAPSFLVTLRNASQVSGRTDQWEVPVIQRSGPPTWPPPNPPIEIKIEW